MNRLDRDLRRRQQGINSSTPSMFLNFAHEPVVVNGLGSLSITRALATATAWCFAETDNAGASLQPIVIPANTVRYYGKRWIASSNTWSDKYASGVAIEKTFLRGLYSESASTNLLLNSSIVVTQNITTTAQAYTLSAWGSGTVTLSGTATGVLTTGGVLHDDRSTLTVTAAAGTLTLTVVGSVVLGQFEAKPMATSYIPTAAAIVTRNADVLTFPNAGNVSETAGTVLLEVVPGYSITPGAVTGYSNARLLDFSVGRAIGISTGTMLSQDGTTIVFSPSWTPVKNTTYKLAYRYGSAGQRNWLSGTAGTNNVFDGSINAGSSMTIGGYGGSDNYNWGGWIKDLKIYKVTLTEGWVVEAQKTYLVDEVGTQLFDESGKAIFYF